MLLYKDRPLSLRPDPSASLGPVSGARPGRTGGAQRPLSYKEILLQDGTCEEPEAPLEPEGKRGREAIEHAPVVPYLRTHSDCWSSSSAASLARLPKGVEPGGLFCVLPAPHPSGVGALTPRHDRHSLPTPLHKGRPWETSKCSRRVVPDSPRPSGDTTAVRARTQDPSAPRVSAGVGTPGAFLRGARAGTSWEDKVS